MHTCPVCGYDRLSEPPRNFTICPCCGTEFEYDDAFATHAQLRAAWLRSGARWWSPVDPRPENWDPYLQVDGVASSLWKVLRTCTPNQPSSGAFGSITNTDRQQSRFLAADPLRIVPKQTYTPQAEAA